MTTVHHAQWPWQRLAVTLILAACALDAVSAESLTRYVDPFIGTDGTGHVMPGASMPWGMVAPSPDMATAGWSYTSGYQYRTPTMLGFSNTHISGAGIPELGDLLLQPAVGTRWSASTTDFAGKYDKSSEAAHPGYYTVKLPDHGVTVELTATSRVAFHRYTFSDDGRVQVLLDVQHGLLYGDGPRVTSAQSMVDATAGEVSGTVRTRGWTDREASFVVRFDRPIVAQQQLPPKPGELAPRYLLEFDLGDRRVLEARVALSTVDVAGARRNLATSDGLAFDPARDQADSAWNSLLGRIDIEADARTKRIFYSALYRTLLHPSDIADVDGRVRGPRGDVIQAPGGRYDSTFSLWDTFRAVHPLYTLVYPERVTGFVTTMLAHHRQQGYLPLWTAWGRETHTMIGNPALPVIADAVAKGFGGFDRNEALQAMIESSTQERPGVPAWAQSSWKLYMRYGYLPFDLEDGEAVSKTMEHGYGDDAVARVALAVGDTATAELFSRRADGWKLLFDPTTRVVRGKDSRGRWREPFDALRATSPLNNPGDYTEANAWQYTATPALHDPLGFREVLGGPKGLEDWLDTFFSLSMPSPDKHLGQEAMIGQYAHGNEPSHHIAWLYSYTDAPDKGERLIERIAREFYTDRPDGIVGNDDCGQMSAWLVFATLGFYPVQPASGTYVAGVPLVSGARVHLAAGRTLFIERASTGGATLNGKPVLRTAISHAALVTGGTLRLGPH
ncbi:MAG: GH92 family glycosyl hydrolase [Steroidobacteraceae bacterium]